MHLDLSSIHIISKKSIVVAVYLKFLEFLDVVITWNVSLLYLFLKPLIKFRNFYYFEEKGDPQALEKQLQSLPQSKVFSVSSTSLLFFFSLVNLLTWFS